jgi:hypothetical protein
MWVMLRWDDQWAGAAPLSASHRIETGGCRSRVPSGHSPLPFLPLARVRYDSTIFGFSQLRESPIKGDFDLKHSQAIHRFMFRDIYE